MDTKAQLIRGTTTFENMVALVNLKIRLLLFKESLFGMYAKFANFVFLNSTIDFVFLKKTKSIAAL